MSLSFISFILFTGLVAIICYWKTRNDHMETADDFFLGGRSLTGWVIAGSLMLTNLSTEHLIGMNGDAFNHTIAIMAWETTAALAMVLAALYFLPKYLYMGLTSIPEYLERRFDSHTRTIATCLFLFSYVVAILPVVLLFGAAGLESIFDVSETFGLTQTEAKWMIVWGVGTLGSLYAIFGGLKAVAISDTINGVGFLIAGLLIPYLALSYVGDGDMWLGLEQVYTQENEKFDITGDEPGSFLPFGVLFTGMIVNQIFFWCTNQSVIQRALAAKNLAEGQKGILIAAVFKIVGPLVIVLPGVIAFHLFKGELAPEDSMLAYPMLVKLVLPPVLIGFFAAVMVGAVLSTFNSVLNSSATLFSEGIYGALINKNATGKQLVFFGRACSVALALIAMIVAPLINSEGSLFNYLQKLNAMFFGPMLAVILLGLLTKNVTALSAKIGIVVGPIIFALLGFVFEEPLQAVLKRIFSLQDDVHFLHFLALVFLITLTLMLIITRFSEPDEQKPVVQTDGHVVDVTPWKHAKLLGVLITLAMVSSFVLLAQ
jgi:SSS family solute:Na+ symporter